MVGFISEPPSPANPTDSLPLCSFHVAIATIGYTEQGIYGLLLVGIGMMRKIMVSMSEEMVKALEQERKARKLESVPETVRSVLGEYFKVKESHG